MTINELYEILLSDNVMELLKEREEDLFVLIPKLKECKGFNQNNPWHPYDVFEHILHVIEYSPKDLNIRLAALFHDIGKPVVYTTDQEGVGHFKGHWKVSLRMFLEFANQNYLDVDTVGIVSKLIYYHDCRFKNDDDHKMDVLIDSFTYDELVALYELKKADLKAQSTKFHFMLQDIDDQEEIILRRYKGMK